MLERFSDAPDEYGEVPFYWWEGEKITKERLLWQLEQLKDRDICALQINYCHTDSGGRNCGLTMDSDPPVFSDEWWELVGWFMQECKKYGIAVSLSDYTLEAPGQERYMDAIAAKHPEVLGKKLELVDGDVVVQEVPYSVDPMNPNLGRYVIEEFYGAFDEHFPGEGGKGLNFFFSDELTFNIGGNLWNDAFEEEFQRRKGYSIMPYRKGIFQDIGDITQKIRLDYCDVIVQLTEEGYFKHIYQWNQERGMIFGGDPCGRGRNVTEYGDYFRTQRWNQAPGNDQPDLSSDIVKSKVSSSISHLYKRPRTWLEGFCGSGWGTSSNDVADATFRNFALGHNLLTLHGLYYSTYGGYWEWSPPCNHFRMPYWKHMDRFLACTKRLSFLLSSGVHVCDVAILYPVAAVEGGLDGETSVETAFAAGEFLYRHTVDFDFLDFESLGRADIEDKCLCVSGERYKTVIVPSMKSIRFSSIQKLWEFSESGGSVMLLGAVPLASDRVGRSDVELDRMVQDIVQKNGNPQNLEEVMRQIRNLTIPDMEGPEHPYMLHRRIDNIDVYMVYGASKGSVYTFRAKGKIMEFDPWSGKEEELACIKQTDQSTTLRMPHSETDVQIIAFDNEGKAKAERDEPVYREIPIEGKWEFELLPTMDNEYGDYSQPPFKGKVGAQARFFTFTQGTREKEVMCSYGTYFYKLGPLTRPCDSEILAMDTYSAGAGIKLDGDFYAFEEYTMSMRYGIPMDAGYQGSYHGLKGRISDEFIGLGNKIVTNIKTNTHYEPEGEGMIYYLATAVVCDEDTEAYVKQGSLKAAQMYINKTPVAGETVNLKRGVNEVLLRYDKAGRTYFILDREKETARQTYPLAMSWYNKDSVLPFCPNFLQKCEPCHFAFTAPPAVKELRFAAVGQVRVLGDEGELTLEKLGSAVHGASLYRAEVKTPTDEPREIQIVIQPRPGCFEASLTEPVDMACGVGLMDTGDWAQISGLRCYSGGAAYTKHITVPKHEQVLMDLGDVGCSVELFVNGRSAGVRMHAPYVFDITQLAQEGEIQIRAEIYNTLYNHYLTIPTYYNTVPRASGLLGPVSLRVR